MVNYTLLFLGIIYLTFLPGFVAVEFFLNELKLYQKVPLYLLFSILISVYVTYISSLIFGFSTRAILFDILIFIFLLIPFLKKIKLKEITFENNAKGLLVGVLVYILFFISLNAGIFRLHNGSYIMSGPNWQDTAMHLSIIENISEGNFPPKAPYFSGENLSYYYFSDLHSAIANNLFGDFFPFILVVLNPFFASLFYLSVYSLTYQLIKNIKFSILSGLMAVFYGNLGFVGLIKDVLSNKGSYFELLTNNPYHLNFESVLQMTPMSDYFLQNRPMMVGLPAFICFILLLVVFSKNNKYKYLVFAAVINSLLIKFQFFGFAVGFLCFAIFVGFRYLFKEVNKSNFKKFITEIVAFILPQVFILIIFGLGKAGSRSLFEVVMESFKFETWQKHTNLWFFNFIIQNINFPIIVFGIVPFFLKKIENRFVNFVYLSGLVIFLIPFLATFTIYPFDMFKFFYYSIPLIAIIFAAFSRYLYRLNKVYGFVILTIFLVTILTSVNMLIHSYLNKSSAYSVADYNAGLWIRKNTPKKSVFITFPGVHSAVTDIGGRLRVLSYINWPYSHGFNVGSDNVFTRLNDINTFFGDSSRDQSYNILQKYAVDYIFLGNEERSNFETSENKLESLKFLEKVYDQDGVKIYKKFE